MSKFPVYVLLIGDIGCGKSKFIQKLSELYPLNLCGRENGYQTYIRNTTDYELFVYNINDADKLKDIKKADVVILSHSSDCPQTFQSLQKRWIPRLAKINAEHLLLMDNTSIPQGILPESQFISVATELGRKLAEGSDLLWCTSYSSGYKEAFAILKNVLKEPMRRNWSSDEGIPDTISENLYNSNECSTNELNTNECSTVGLRTNEFPTNELNSTEFSAVGLKTNEFPTNELNFSECSTAVFGPNEFPTNELNFSECSTAVFGLNEFSTGGECTPDNCSPVRIHGLMKFQVQMQNSLRMILVQMKIQVDTK